MTRKLHYFYVATAILSYSFNSMQLAAGSQGISGGNPRSAIAHSIQNYSFRSSVPGSFQMVGSRSVYGFSSESFELVVESTHLPACVGTSIQFKVVCDSTVNDGRVGKFVVFWAEAAFWVEVKSTLLSQAQKEAVLESIVLSFVYNKPSKEN